MMNLDEAIKYCIENADAYEKMAYEIAMQDDNGVYQTRVSWYEDKAENQRQIAEWLRELKDYKDARVGCEYCKHKFREQHERPCSLCQRNFVDKFEREVNADERRQL